MTKGEQIDLIYNHLRSLASDVDYNFGSLSSDWGKTNSPLYNSRKSQFERSVSRLAKSCSIKSYGGSLYVFNGKVYARVSQEMVEHAYELLLSDLAIAPMQHRPVFRRECFVKTILFYNEIMPRLDMVAFSNGVLDMSDCRKPVLREFSPDFPVTYYRPYDYDEDAVCDRWQLFLKEVLPDKESRTILQMFMGLGLMQRESAFSGKGASGGKVELCLLLVGSGANGKSVIFEVMRALFGDEKISTVDYDTLTADGDEGMRGRLPIRSAVFNWSSDSDPRKFGKRNTGVFKRLVSGEPVQDRKLGEDVMTNRQIPYLVFNLNDLPASADDSGGFMRRLQIIPFDVTVPRSKRDPDLANKIIRNELPGVFNWVMRGTKELVRRRFRFPDAEGSKRALLKALIRTSPILAWLKAYGMRCEKAAPNEVPVCILSKDLYEAFTRFCTDNDVDEKDIPTANRFGRTLWDKCMFFRKRTGTGVYYETYGVTLDRLAEPLFVTDLHDIDGGETAGAESFIKDDD